MLAWQRYGKHVHLHSSQIVETQEVSTVSKIIHAAQGLKAFTYAISIGVIYILSLLFAMGFVCCSRFFAQENQLNKLLSPSHTITFIL